jgi:hypothetical protein
MGVKLGLRMFENKVLRRLFRQRGRMWQEAE